MKQERKININMLSSAESVPGQGVASAYIELLQLLREYGNECIDIQVNKGINFDILHAQTIDPLNYAKFVFSKAAKIIHVHFLPQTLDGSLRMPGWFFRVFKKYVIHFYKKADVLVVVNSAMIPQMIEAGLDETKIRYIPNFVSKKNFFKLSQDKIANIRKNYGFSEDSFVVMGAGQLQTRKGVSDFVEIAKKNPDMKFIWAGGFSFGMITDGYDEIKKMEKNAPPNLTFTGIVTREIMNELYNISNVYFSPSYDELFPMTILEAASCETPIVIRNLELYEPILGNCCLYGKDNENFTEQLQLLKNDATMYKIQMEKSRDLAEKYSEETIWLQWKKLYEEVCLWSRQNK